jgi:hypothetical protein
MIDIMDIRQQAQSEVVTENFLKDSMEGTADSRYSRLKRWNRDGKLVRLSRGIYVFGEKYRKKETGIYAAAQYIYGPSYISFESALSYRGLIPEAVYSVVSACKGRAKDIKTPVGMFSYRPVNYGVFFAGVKRAEQAAGSFFVASPFKALADMMYARGKKWKRFEDAVLDLRLDTEEITADDTGLIDEMLKSCKKRSISEFLENCRKEMTK